MKGILNRLSANRNYLISLALSILAAFIIGALLMLVTGYNPAAGYSAMLKGAFGSFRVFGNTLAKMLTLCLTGLATAVGARAGLFNVEAAKQLPIPKNYWGRLQHGETVAYEGCTYTPDMVMGEPRKGIKLTYCTDTRPTQSLVEAAKGSDLLICEGMYAEPEKLAKAKQYKHMTFYEAARVAKDAEVGQLWLTHFSPSLIHPENYMDAVRKIYKEASLGKDGRFVELDFQEDKT